MDNLFQQSNAPCRRLVRGGLVVVGARDVRQADMLISEKGIILDIAPDIEPEGDMQLIDAAGCIASPGLVDMHQHLDKTGVLRFAPNPSGTLQGARDAFAKYARQAPPDDILKRASRTIERCLSRGTTAIRSHVNVDKDAGFNGIEALAKLRSDWADRVKLQLVAFMIPHPGQDLDWLEANIDRAVALADAVGARPQWRKTRSVISISCSPLLHGMAVQSTCISMNISTRNARFSTPSSSGSAAMVWRHVPCSAMLRFSVR